MASGSPWLYVLEPHHFLCHQSAPFFNGISYPGLQRGANTASVTPLASTYLMVWQMVCPLGLLGAHNLLMGLLATLAFPFQHAHFPEPLLPSSTSHHGNSGLWLTPPVHCTFETEAITAVSSHHFLGSSLSVILCLRKNNPKSADCSLPCFPAPFDQGPQNSVLPVLPRASVHREASALLSGVAPCLPCQLSTQEDLGSTALCLPQSLSKLFIIWGFKQWFPFKRTKTLLIFAKNPTASTKGPYESGEIKHSFGNITTPQLPSLPHLTA